MAQEMFLDPGRYGVVAAVLAILLLALAAPVAAAEKTIYNSTDALKNAVSGASDGDVIILQPGIYSENTIIITKRLTIRANTSYGHTAADTIIDGMEAGSSILTINSGCTLTLDNITLQNGTTTVGGAIYSDGTNSVITSCIIRDCAVSGGGGAIHNTGTFASIASTTFSECTANPGGGALAEGGAIRNTGTIASISSTTFSGCTASSNGGAISNSGTITAISSSTFTNCRTGYSGGAIYNVDIATITSITSTTFNGCTATENGGAIFSTSGSTIGAITSSTFTGCTASNVGGAIKISGPTEITSSTFSGCTATNGGAIYFSGAYTDTISFSRFYQNTASANGPAVYAWSASVDAANTWWGSNNNPSSQVYGPVTTSPWLVLNASVSSSSITTAQTTTVRMNLTNASDGTTITDTASGGTFVPNTVPVAFSLSGVSGSLSPVDGNTSAGANTTRFAPSTNGMATITVTVDSQSVTVPVTVTLAATSTPTSSDNSGGGSDDNDMARRVFPVGTVTVNIGGDSNVYRAVVTGTGLKDLIVTGTVQAGPGTNQTAPTGTVYQYIRLEPARYTTVTNADILFSIPQSWLDENQIDPATIVLYHMTENGWVALPTTVASTKDGAVYFSATTSGFSLFAVAGTPGSATAATPPLLTTTTVAPAATAENLQKAETPASVTKVPITTQTTAPPVSPATAAAQPPVMSILLVIAAIAVLSAGGFFARRWWLHRQNPALFEDS